MSRALLIVLFIVSKAWAQNLVPNPGFETYSTPPSSSGQYNLATGWDNCNGGGSPDYFSTLGSGLVKLPNCFIGTVNPHSGKGCMGAALYYYSPPSYREYIDIQLALTMIPGRKYDVSFYISNGVTAGTYGGGGIDQVSVAFSTSQLKQSGTAPISFPAQYTYGSLLYNKGWQLISFQFTADSAYRHLTLGNFKYDVATLYQQYDPCSNYGAYYFFDDFSVQEVGGVPPVAGFTTTDTVICAETCISFSNLSSNASSCHWFFQGAMPSSDTSMNPQNICYLNAGNYDVTLVAINNAGADTLKFTNYISVAAVPPTPVITQHDDTLFCSIDPSYTGYQWYSDTMLIPGATGPTLVISKDGNYNVQVSNSNGCRIAVGINIILGVNPLATDDLEFTISPNPVGNELRISNSKFSIEKIRIYNQLGQMLYQSSISNAQHEIDVSILPPGIYLLCIITDEGRVLGRFVKE